MKSLYIVYPELGKVEVSEEEITPPGPNEVLCAAEKSLISIGTETYCLRGVFDPGTNWEQWVQFPFRPGYSMAGRIIEVGQEVSGLKVGDRVGVWATHQQFFKIRPEQAHPLPAPISYEEATWLNLACTAQMGVRRAEHHLGETVGVVGAGMVGQLVIQYLLLSGARKIIAIDPVRGRLDVAEAHGATHTLAMDVGSARPEIERITDGRLLDVVYDITGHPAVLASCLRLVRKLGRVILLGDTPTPTQQHLGPGVVSDSIAILGVHGSMTPANSSPYNPWTRKEVTALFFEYLIQKRMSVSGLISKRHSPLDAPRVYADLVKHNSSEIGVIFDWSLL